MREPGTRREHLYKAMIKRYECEQEDALVKIDGLMAGDIVPGHTDITGEIDKLLCKIVLADQKMAKLRQHYGTN